MTDKVQKIREEVARIQLYSQSEVLKQVLDYIDEVQKETVSNPIDFEKELYKAFGQVKDFTLGMRIAKWFYDMGKNNKEPLSEDLEQAIDTYLATYFGGEKEKQEWPFLKKMAIHFAEWQKQKDAEALNENALLYNARLEGIEIGKAEMKQQMMARAVDAVVKIDAGGYPYVDRTIELYDYDKDVPLAKRGDKVKVIVIKED